MTHFLLILLLMPTLAISMVDLSFRADSVSHNTNYKNTSTPSTSHFEVNYAKVRYGANIIDDFYFNGLVSFKNFQSSNKVAKISDTIETFSITHKIDSSLKLTFGKDWNRAGNWENDRVTYATYHFSEASWNVPFNFVGVYIDKSLGNHFFNFSLFTPDNNTDGTDSKNGNPKQSTYGTGIKWIQKLNNLKTLAHYHLLPHSYSEQTDHFYGIGLKYTSANIDLEVDLSQNKYENKTTDKKNDLETSGISRLSFLMDKHRPFIKFIHDEIDVSETLSQKSSSMVIGYEYYPKDKYPKFNYHAVYINKNTDYLNDIDEKESAHTIFVGLSIGNIKM